MAKTRVQISDALIIRAFQTPNSGAGVYEWRDALVLRGNQYAVAISPVNEVQDAMHRGGVVGTFAASWGWNRRGTKGHRHIGRLFNDAPHADIVDGGRREAFAWQRFSWTEWGGEINAVWRTSARPGYNIIADVGRHMYLLMTKGGTLPKPFGSSISRKPRAPRA